MSRYSEAQQRAIYKWRLNNPHHYLALQRVYRHKYYHFQKAWHELLRLGDLFKD